MAKLRAVEPDQLTGIGTGDWPPAGAYFQALPAMLSEISEVRLAHVDFARVLSLLTPQLGTP